jgi:O-antigen/teichoic acid export membrane protein
MFPIVYLIFHLEQFNPEYQWLFYLVLITEHLNFEFYRLLFVFKKPTSANINIFLRNGLWVVFAGLQIYLNNYISIKEVLTYWLIGNVSALVYSLGISYGKRHKISLKNFKFDKNWIIKGLMVSIPYILATIFYKTIEFSDRFIIDYYMDKKAVGIYSFFANIANVLNIVLFTLVISVLYPTLVKTIITKDKSGFQKIYKQFKKEIYYYSTGMIVLLSIALPIILYIIDKNEYLKQFHIFLWLIFGNFLLNISMLYHFIIYAYKKDWLIFKATFLGAIINILLNILLIPIFGIAGASFATFASFLLIFFIKNKNARMHLFTS